MAYADCVAIDDQRFPVPLYCARKNPVRGIESGQIRHGIQVGRFVDRDDLVFMAQGGFMQRAQEAAANPAVTVDGQTYGGIHGGVPVEKISGRTRDRKSVVEGKSVSVSVDLGGRCISKKKKTRSKERMK